MSRTRGDTAFTLMETGRVGASNGAPWLPLGVVLALTSGFGMAALPSLLSYPNVWAIVFALFGLAWMGLFPKIEVVALFLVVSVVLQNYLVADVGFLILPAYPIALLALLRLILAGQFRILKTPLNRPIALLLLVASISVPVAAYLGPRFPASVSQLRYSAIRPLVQFGVLLILMAAFSVTVLVVSTTERTYARALKALLWTGTLVSIYALYQEVAFYAGWPTLDFLGANSPALGLFSPIQGSLSVYRANASFVEPNNLGHFLIGVLSLTISLWVVRRRLGRFGRWLTPMLTLQGLALMSTFSGGAYAGLAAASIVFVLMGKRRTRLILAGMLLAVLGLAAGRALTSALFPTPQKGAVELLSSRALVTLSIERLPASASNPYVGYRRSDYWRAALEMAKLHPLTGVGIGNFGAGAVAVNPQLLPNAGSYGVMSGILGEFGFVGLGVLVYLVGTFIRSVWSSYRRSPSLNPELLGFLAGFVGMMVQYVSSGYTRMDIHMWVFMALAMVAVRLANVGQGTMGVALERSPSYAGPA